MRRDIFYQMLGNTLSEQRPLEVLKQQAAANVHAVGQQKHCHLIFDALVRCHIGIIAVYRIDSIIDRIHGLSSHTRA